MTNVFPQRFAEAPSYIYVTYRREYHLFQNYCQGKIEETSERVGMKVIDASVPLSETFGYATSIRSLTEGRASFTMEFDRYEPVPGNIAQEIIDGKRK